MGAPTVSVVVVSHGRPAWLSRCITAVSQLDYPTFEVVVVADGDGAAALSAHHQGAKVKVVDCEEENISKARNLGATAAAGEILAFIDDDAVPEPLWLYHHIKGLEATAASATVGYVRGRNGISYQSQCVSIDHDGNSHKEAHTSSDPVIPIFPSGRVLKLIGTNFCVRRAVFDAVGGFDPSFRFFHDDSDFSLRLASANFCSAVVPLAEIHHRVAPSVRRTRQRFPKSLYEVARSTAIFARKHSKIPLSEHFGRALIEQKQRLLWHMVRGSCEPRDVQRVIGTFYEGWEDGVSCDLGRTLVSPSQDIEFKHFKSNFSSNGFLACRFVNRAKTRRDAESAALSGQRVTLLSFSPTTLRHHHRFAENGYWEQVGGLWGPSDRSQPWFRWCTFANRVKEECARVEKQRGIMKNIGVWGSKA